jgi:hypothetical protein
MKRISTIFLVLVSFAGGAAAAMQSGTSARVQRFATPELCYLDVAAAERDALQVRAELQRRDVTCTSELRTEGRHALEKRVRLARLQAASASFQGATAAREISDRRETERLIRCATGNSGQGGCPNH